MYSTKNVNRKTHCQLQAEQRRVRNTKSKQHRRANPTVPHRPRFEHHYTDTLRDVYNALSKTKSGAKVYITTIKDLIMRMKWEYWRDNEVTPKTMRSYIHKLAAFEMVEASHKNGVWTIKIIGGELPKPSEIRAKFFSLYRCPRTFPLGIYNVFNKQCGSVVTKEILPKVTSSSINNTSALARVAVANVHSVNQDSLLSRARGIMDDFFSNSRQKTYYEEAQEYEKMAASNQERRRAGINAHRKDRGMELMPEDMPLREPRKETRRDSRHQYTQTHTNVAPTPEYVQTTSEEEIKDAVEAIHTPENNAKFEETMDKLRGGILGAYMK